MAFKKKVVVETVEEPKVDTKTKKTETKLDADFIDVPKTKLEEIKPMQTNLVESEIPKVDTTVDKFWLKEGYDFLKDNKWKNFPEAEEYFLLMICG